MSRIVIGTVGRAIGVGLLIAGAAVLVALLIG